MSIASTSCDEITCFRSVFSSGVACSVFIGLKVMHGTLVFLLLLKRDVMLSKTVIMLHSLHIVNVKLDLLSCCDTSVSF